MILLDNVKYRELCELLSDHKIVLFGAGKAANTSLNHLKKINNDLLDKIDCIIDNSSAKWNTKFNYGKYEYDIISAETLRKKWSGQLIIISSQAMEEISEQLNNIHEVDSAKVIFYEDIIYARLMNEFWLPDNIRITDKPLIPKVIHYCWFGRNPIPDRYREWMSTWKKYCPDYEIVEWNEDNYDYKKNEYMYEAYKAKKWGFVPDYARLDIIYNCGGIYLDTDVELVKNLDDLLYQKAFAGLQRDLRVANGLGFGSIPYLPNLKKQISVYDDRHFIKKDGTFDLTPAPTMQTEIMEQNGFVKINKYQIVDDVTIYPAPVLGGIIGSRAIINDSVYAIHHYDGSWVPAEKKARRANWYKRIEDSLKFIVKNKLCCK